MLGKRQRVDARVLGGLCGALCELRKELGLARLLLRQASCSTLLQRGHLEAMPRPLAQQLPPFLAVLSRPRARASRPRCRQRGRG
eukprot:2676280-Pleurochrysis_carterae.AAC.1